MQVINLIGIHDRASEHFFDLLSRVKVLDSLEETKNWTEILSFSTKWACAFGSSYDPDASDEESLEDYYVDLGAEKSDKYIHWFNDFSKSLYAFGDVEIEATLDEFPKYGSWWVDTCPWDPKYSDTSGSTYRKLEETKDFYWFLVLCIQRLGSFVETNVDINRVKSVIESTSKENSDVFNWSIFSPLKTWIESKTLESSFKNKSFKSISEEIKNYQFDFDLSEAVDLDEIPEFAIEDNYVYYEDNYYELDYVIRAITASGGFAQSLERQDLEDKITTANSLVKKTKKKKFRIKKDELRKA